MRAGERELCLAMIERGALPCRRRMADRTIGRETCLSMIGVGRAVVIGLMASHASGRRTRELVVGVALRARQGGVDSGERKVRLAVIECGALPARRCVTDRAVLWETRRHMVRVGGARKICHVA